jgi:hypothetical protein
VNLSGVDRTDSDPMPSTKLLPLTTLVSAMKATGIVLGAADVLGPRGPRTATAQVGSDAFLYISLFGGTQIVHVHVQTYRSYRSPKPSAACAQGT